jgi:hypothetical protein
MITQLFSHSLLFHSPLRYLHLRDPQDCVCSAQYL